MKSQLLFLLVLSLVMHQAVGKTIPNHPIADLVLGLSDFSASVAPNPPSAASLSQSAAIVIDPTSRKVSVADGANNRILR